MSDTKYNLPKMDDTSEEIDTCEQKDENEEIYDKKINHIKVRESLDRIVDELNRSFTIEIENLFYQNDIKESTVKRAMWE